MSSSSRAVERVADARVTGESLAIRLVDGRVITVPVAWFPRLRAGTAKQRSNWYPAGGGYGIHWPDLDEDLSVTGLLRDIAAPEHQA